MTYFIQTVDIAKRTLKETFKPRKRNYTKWVTISVILAVVAIASTMFIDAVFITHVDLLYAGDALQLTNPAVYAEQGYVTVQVKSIWNTPVNDIYATLLVADNAGGGAAECAAGIEPLAVSTSATLSKKDLDPGESVTIFGRLYTFDPTTADIANDASGPTCIANQLGDKTEYVLQITGNFDGNTVMKTQTVLTS